MSKTATAGIRDNAVNTGSKRPPIRPDDRNDSISKASRRAWWLVVCVVGVALLLLVYKWAQHPGSLVDTTRFRLGPHSTLLSSAQTREYHLTVDGEISSPDGVEKRVYTINGMFPGPTIEARAGDTVIIHVHNQLNEETSLHWHGLRHEYGSNSQDGTIGVTQCPIQPNTTFTYRWQLSEHQSGTFWYHSHHTTQRADGLYGAFIIHPAADSVRPIDLGLRWQRVPATTEVSLVLLMGDWYHRSGEETLAWYRSGRSRGDEPVPDNVLINGKNVYKCENSIRRIKCDATLGTLPKYRLDASKSNVLRLINVGSLAVIHFSVDGHLLKIVEADGSDVVHVVTKELPIAPGQRYSAMLIPQDTLIRTKSYWFRSRLDQECFNYPNRALDPEPKGVFHYGGVWYQPSKSPTTARWNVSDAASKFDPMRLVPLDPASRKLPDAEANVILYVNTESRQSTGGIPTAFINQTSWRPNPYNPLLARDVSSMGTGRLSSSELVVSTPPNRSTILDIIVNNFEQGPHPFHLHGHSFWPLHSYSARYGKGAYNWNTPPELPTAAPALRDTFVVPPYGHVVFRVLFDTPGEWLFHCHVLVHLATGMGIVFNVRSDDISAQEQRKALESCGGVRLA